MSEVYTRKQLKAMSPEEREALFVSFTEGEPVLGTPPAKPAYRAAAPPTPTFTGRVRLEQLIGRGQTAQGERLFRQPVDRVFVNDEHLAMIGRFPNAPLNFIVGGLGEEARQAILKEVIDQRANSPNEKERLMTPNPVLAPAMPAPDELEMVFDELEGGEEPEDATQPVEEADEPGHGLEHEREPGM